MSFSLTQFGRIWRSAKRNSFLQESDEQAGDDRGEKRDEKGNENGLSRLEVQSREVDGSDVKDRFGRAVAGTGTARNKTVRAVSGEDFRQQSGASAPRKGFEQKKGQNLFGNTERAHDGGKQGDEQVGQSRSGAKLCEQKHRRKIGEEGKNEGRHRFDSPDKAFVRFFLFEQGVKEEEKEEDGNEIAHR